MARKPRGGLYSRESLKAIETLFPPAWFSRFSMHGNGDWTPQKVFWMSIVMSWQPQTTLTEQFDAARDVLRRMFPRWKLGRTSGTFLTARQRLLAEMHGPLRQRLQLFVAACFEAWRVWGWSLFAVDGSRFETPRTTPNEQRLGCAGKESTTPQLFQTTLQHVGTGLVYDFRLGPGTDSERRHLDDMLATLPPHSLLTADAGFISFALCRWLVTQQHSFLLRVGANVRLLTKLGWDVEIEGTTVYLWPQTQRRLPPVVLRLLVITEGAKQPVYLVTNIQDAQQLSDTDAAELYRLRWGIELYYRAFKQTLGHKTLRSRTPHMALAEQTWHLFATWLLQLVTARELIAAKKSPASWSAAKARDAVRRLFRRALSQQRCTATETLAVRLQQATRDTYQRRGPKQIREWPRKKREQPPGPPKLQPASNQERHQAQRLKDALLPK